MASEKVSFGNWIIFALALAEVTAWTIDLPEVRKYFFEKNARENKIEGYEYKSGEEIAGQVYYNNIDGNSKHNSKYYENVYENIPYAKQYGYGSYMEKKVLGIVYNGSVYLEGLRRSLENYTRFLESCNRMDSRNESSSQNTTTWRPPVEFPPRNSTQRNNSTTTQSNNSTNTQRNNSTNTQRNNSTNTQRNNSTNTQRNNSTTSDRINSINSRCREATRTSEHVRRLSELAMWATRELQDIAYARKYKKGDYHDLTMEENELILKLAWFLDRLAFYTGYEPEPEDFAERDGQRTTTTTTPPPLSLVSPSVEVTRSMMECLQMDSPEPADVRCRYPEPMPPIIRMMMDMNNNINGIPSMPSPSSTNGNEQVLPLGSESRLNPVSEQSMELLIASDNRTPASNFPPIFTAVRNVQKRSISSMPQPEVLLNAPKEKRLIEDDPAIHFLKYYAKHKVWEGSNLNNVDTKSTFEEYEVKNHLANHKIEKRVIDNKKSKHLKLPENPFQDLSKYIKYKPGVNYIKDEAHAEKIKAALEKIENAKSSSSKNLIRKLTKMYRPKRSIKFEKDVDLPRDSVDPQRDISYYTKNKPGRNYNNDLLQAAQVRAGLQQIFETGNIEVVRRFGANYNPAVPSPFYAGVLLSQADF